ncbi:MAG: thioredoxin fold domain-containing protein [Flavobacteriales bacterium]|nr:thioredoxin fold domain-containing protein [Flavobacteriales bacterium]
MRHFSLSISLGFIVALLFTSSCQTTGQNAIETLEPAAFQTQITETVNAQVLDVRTPAEFAKSFIAGAQNIDWNNSDFEKQLAPISKDEPVFVYCLSGGRSGSASKRLQKLGYSKIYDLKGGILAWGNKNLPVVTPKGATQQGMNLEQYESELVADVPVLVDFYAPWCAPCKKMTPMIESLSASKSGQFKLVKLNADDNKALMKALDVNEIPTLLIYKNGEITWQHVGLVDEATLLTELGL